MTKKFKTIKLQGKDYIPVNERVRVMREDYPNASLITKCTIGDEGTVLFRATLKIPIGDTELVCTGHSYGKAGAVKAFEKLETVAVGRALAHAGYIADGDIASFEEMQMHIESEAEEFEVSDEELEAITTQIKKFKTIDELRKYFLELPRHIKGNKRVLELKNQYKDKLTKKQNARAKS